MSRDMGELSEGFAGKAELLLKSLETKKIIMVPYCTGRHPREQAKLWRQSRPSGYIHKKIEILRSEGADYLAKILDEVGPCFGPSVTGALPGESWHQWGEAMDCYWLVKGRAVWDAERIEFIFGEAINGYKKYNQLAEKNGLTTITFNRGTVDWPHVQGPSESSPHSDYSWSEIDVKMMEKYGG